MRPLEPVRNRSAQPSRQGTWRSAVAPGVILLAAFALRLLRLGDANLWWDEALAVWAVRKGLAGATLWTAGDVHPPLFFWSLWGWVQIMGESEFALRALSVLFGVLTVAVVYRLGCLASGRTVGLLAATLTATARFHVWWSQELRMYALAGLLGMSALYFFLRWLHAERDARPEARNNGWLFWGAYILCAAGSLYTVFLMGALVLAQNLVVLILLVCPTGYRRARLVARWCGAQLVILALLAIWLVISWGRMPTWSVSEPFGVAAFMQLMAALLTTGVSVHIEQVAWAAILPYWVLSVGAILGLRAWRRQVIPEQAIAALTLTFSLVLPPFVIYLSTLPRGLFYTPKIEARYFAPFAPVFWVLLAWSITLIARKTRLGWPIGAAVLATWIVFLPGHYSSRYLRDELQTMTQTILSQAEPGDAVLLDSGGRYPIFLYYYERDRSAPYRPPMVTVSRSEDQISADQVDEKLRDFAQDYQRIWLAEVDVHLTDPERLVQGWLRSNYKEALAKRYNHNMLYLFSRDATPPALAGGYAPQHVVNAATENGGLLLGWEMPVARFTGGDTAYISLLWERQPDVNVTIALRDQRGQVMLEQTIQAGVPELGYQRQQFDLLIPGYFPNGEYDIILSPALKTGAALGRLCVAGNVAVMQDTTPQVQVNARLGDNITLLGYTIQGANRQGLAATAGGELTLDVYWRAEHKPDRDYTVFTHLLGAMLNPKTQGPVWGQHDAQPMDNRLPTSQWREGQVVVDRHTIPIDSDAPAGEYQIEIGMYTPEDGRRLEVVAQDGQSLGDHLVLSTPIRVKRR